MLFLFNRLLLDVLLIDSKGMSWTKKHNTTGQHFKCLKLTYS